MNSFKKYVSKLSTNELKSLAEKYSSYVVKFEIENESILNRHSILFNEMRARGYGYDFVTGKYIIPTKESVKIIYGRNERNRLLQMQ